MNIGQSDDIQGGEFLEYLKKIKYLRRTLFHGVSLHAVGFVFSYLPLNLIMKLIGIGPHLKPV
jgi:hypothetical protein